MQTCLSQMSFIPNPYGCMCQVSYYVSYRWRALPVVCCHRAERLKMEKDYLELQSKAFAAPGSALAEVRYDVRRVLAVVCNCVTKQCQCDGNAGASDNDSCNSHSDFC